jgi:hypothetical protein
LSLYADLYEQIGDNIYPYLENLNQKTKNQILDRLKLVQLNKKEDFNPNETQESLAKPQEINLGKDSALENLFDDVKIQETTYSS